MNKLWTQSKRIFRYLQRLCSAMMGRATRGTGIAVKTIGGTVAAVLAFVIMAAVLLVIGIAAVPYGAFALSKEPPEVAVIDSNISTDCESVPIVHDESFCVNCGDLEARLHSDTQLCEECMKPEPKKEDANEEVTKQS